jgi:hypothetical protein
MHVAIKNHSHVTKLSLYLAQHQVYIMGFALTTVLQSICRKVLKLLEFTEIRQIRSLTSESDRKRTHLVRF